MLKIRRDSTVSELDERLKEAKLTNKKFRKQLLQKDSELQVNFYTLIKLSNDVTHGKTLSDRERGGRGGVGSNS